jgi:ribonucleoside-diphosphate reductase alpha chain
MDDITKLQVESWLGKDNQIGVDIWERKYRYDHENLEQWFDRVSGGDEDVRQLIKNKKFLFAGRILANRGLYKDGRKVTYSNCYVIPPPEDSLESIFDCAKSLARTFSYGGGCGIDISKLSPRGAHINNAAKETSGAVSFMDLYSLTTELIGQNGRRGALMISISCDHPDIEEFITIKSDLNKITKANLSIRVTDKFMQAVDYDTTYTLSYVREETGEKIERKIRAKELFDKFCYMNWDYAEPAFLFWDRIKSYNLLSEDDAFEYAGVNPCAEEPLPSGGSCLLGSLNLAAFVETIEGQPQFNMDEFRKAVTIAVYGLNDVLDEGLSLHPLSVQRDSVRDWRQIGLGIMGLADMLIKLGVTYGSKESLKICDNIGWNLANEALTTSMTIAKNKGEYPMFSDKVWESEFYKNHIGISAPLRNSQLLTIAPTGTLSTMLGISGGIEPIFANYYTRKTESLHGEDKEYKIFTPIAWEYLKSHGYGEDETKLPDYFVTSAEIAYRDRINMQAIWQTHIDASISSTVNLPNSATIDDVKDLYMYAWECGLKGITVFRDGCKRLGILTTDDGEDSVDYLTDLRRGDIINVDDDLLGYKRKIINGCGDFSEQIFFDDISGEPLENFIAMGDGGGCARNLEAISRLISLCLRGGIDVSEIIKQLKKVHSCPAYRARKIQKGDTSVGTSCPSAIGYAIEELCNKINDRLFDGVESKDDLLWDDSDHNMMIESWYEDSKSEVEDLTTKPTCPECGEPIVFEGGCNICKSCGWSKCD